MESANLHHHHQLQDQLVGGSSSLSTPSWYAAASNHHARTPNTNTLNNGNRNENNDEENLCNSRVQKNDILVPPSVAPSSSSSSSSSSMIQDLGFQYWTSSNNTAGSREQKDHFNDDDQLSHQKLLLNTISSSAFQISGDQFQYGLTYMPSRGNFSQIFPSINISNLSAARSISSEISSSFAINLEALDLLTSARFSENFSESLHDNLGLVEESPSFASHHMHQSRQKPPSSPNYTISPFINGVTETKRLSNTIMEPKSSQAAAKKSRLETRACPPFKVRKEKLGDRIAALQQLVAPFGKTDTASVLMEAIGYIKFLQNQVETLSVPYMKSARNKTHRTPQPGQTEGDGNEERKRDLKSRGLCLVPLSCMSYVTNDGGGGGVIWPHDGYHGCT